MRDRIRHTLALEIVDSTTSLQMGKAEAQVFLETLCMSQEMASAFALLVDKINLHCCDDIVCKSRKALGFTEHIAPMSSLLETEKQFKALFELMAAWGIGCGLMIGKSIMYSGLCDRTASKILEDVFTGNMRDDSFYYRTPELRQRVECYYGTPEPIYQGDGDSKRLIGYNGNLLIPLLSAGLQDGTAFEKLYSDYDAPVATSPQDSKNAPHCEEWLDTFDLEGEQ